MLRDDVTSDEMTLHLNLQLCMR